MPELPEIETIRRQLAEAIIGKKWKGKKIIGVRRRGKMLIIDFTDGSSLVFHLKLTGQLIFNGQPERYMRQVFNLSDGSNLVFNDARKFGWCKEVKNADSLKEIKNLGPDALEIGQGEFVKRIFNKKNAKIKLLLMDQKFISGIGNIYADEILFDAGVSPIRFVKTLKLSEARRIFLSMGKILRVAIKAGGSSVKDYLDSRGKKGDYVKHHKVYQRVGQKCFRCASIIKRITMNGRGTHFCPKCQH